MHPPEGQRRVRLADGGRDPDLHAALRPEVAGGLLRRGEQAIVRRGATTRIGPPSAPARVDYEYERKGVCCQLVMCEPLRGWRHVTVTERRTRQDYAHCIRDMVDRHFPRATKIRLVQDNLNTHDGASLYEAFPPAEARRILDKIEFHYTPKHGSWLNMAETEISIMNGQCLDRRLDSQSMMAEEVAAWEDERNKRKARIHWTFTLAVARQKLRKLYPSIEDCWPTSGPTICQRPVEPYLRAAALARANGGRLSLPGRPADGDSPLDPKPSAPPRGALYRHGWSPVPSVLVPGKNGRRKIRGRDASGSGWA